MAGVSGARRGVNRWLNRLVRQSVSLRADAAFCRADLRMVDKCLAGHPRDIRVALRCTPGFISPSN
jgi:hypothetical protein